MGIDPKDVLAVVITKWDHVPILVSQHLTMYFREVASCTGNTNNLSVFKRYVPGLNEWSHDKKVIYVQDDDCLVDIPEVLAHYEPGVVTCNIRHTHTDWYTDKFYNVAPVGWGAVFDRDLIEPAFSRYLSIYPRDDFFLRECDRIFTGLNRVKRVTAGCVNLPWAHAGDRMGNETRHAGDFNEAVRRVEGLMRLEK